MTVCHLRGALVDGRGFFPLDPTDYQHPRVMPGVGCSNLHCSDCHVAVRQRARVRVRSGAGLQARDLYDFDDWAAHADVEPSYGGRLYACRCTLWLESRLRYLEDTDPGIFEPSFPGSARGTRPRRLRLSSMGSSSTPRVSGR
jgi:hypothetical protein